MPIHDWTRVEAGLFHHFHQRWTLEIADRLNAGALPEGYYALAEQGVGGPIPDVVALRRPSSDRTHEREPEPDGPGGVALAEAPPRTWLQREVGPDVYARRADRIAVHHSLGEVVAIIEIVSPGNKSSRAALRSFVEKCRDLLNKGVNLLIVDLFPPSPRDPRGIHKAIWDEFIDEPYDPPAGKDRTIAAYVGGVLKRAYVEPVAVGDPLSDLPIFLSAETYVPAPLEATYAATWGVCPAPIREMVEAPAAPLDDRAGGPLR